MEIKDLVGKTIITTTLMKKADYDDTGWLKLDFSDGTCCVIVSDYGGYTGDSRDEYPTFIRVSDDTRDLVEVVNDEEI